MINTNFKVYSDVNGGDPDSTSTTLLNYHKELWNKTLPNETIFELTDKKSGIDLYHNSELGGFLLGSDAITHSYKNNARKKWLIKQIYDNVNELFEISSTIGAYTIFPKNKIDHKLTINEERGVNKFIDDRFDLKLECIRLFYIGQTSPLYDTLYRYRNFFKMFDNFLGYVKFFLLDDLIDNRQQVKFYLPFDNFKTKPTFNDVKDYLTYKNKVTKFIQSRNNRINKYVEQLIQ
ncbi:MAG: hypothetical protein H6613_02320 [Ignavibacteriales bacterium]|nr:hypothetical protein [Ignavibacteriales bacterium]